MKQQEETENYIKDGLHFGSWIMIALSGLIGWIMCFVTSIHYFGLAGMFGVPLLTGIAGLSIYHKIK